jgi:HKD family nuclease
MTPYLQIQSQQSTLEHWRQILAGNKLPSLAAFAYVTDSGVAQVRTQLKDYLGKPRDCRWLFSLDYGRSHPTALRALGKFGNSEIRIYDGEYVIQSKSFIPRVSYHLKTALTLQKSGYPSQQIVGSGNLSASGLLSGIEAGCTVDYSKIDQKIGMTLIGKLEAMWDCSTPLENVIKDYERQYAEVIQPAVSTGEHPAYSGASTLFWIDVGYVTKNRGADKPGNQFDLPRSAHIHLGVKKVSHPERNSVLADLTIKTPDGTLVPRRLRFGNNDMEKLTLPIPEQYGYESYDGKILTFRKQGDDLLLEALEPDDFLQVYGRRISSVREMRGGRKYGTVSLS